VPKTQRVERVEFTRCPYDASPIEAAMYPGGSTLLTCSTCGAAWEWYRTWLRRIREPDRDLVRAARATDEPVRVVRGAPVPAFADHLWRHVRSSSAAVPQRSNPRPPTPERRS
jgi:hypothetical protein